MRKSLLVMMAAVLSSTIVVAEPLRVRKPDAAAQSDKQVPIRRSNPANACAQYGAGFVMIEGTSTCMKIGGAIGIGAGVSSGSR